MQITISKITKTLYLQLGGCTAISLEEMGIRRFSLHGIDEIELDDIFIKDEE